MWIVDEAAELEADIARLDRLTPAQLAAETAACEALAAFGPYALEPGDLRYRAELEKRAHLAHA